MKHTTYVSTDGHAVIPEAKENTQEGRTQSWTRQHTLIDVETFVSEGAVEYYSVFTIVVGHEVGNVPTFSSGRGLRGQFSHSIGND